MSLKLEASILPHIETTHLVTCGFCGRAGRSADSLKEAAAIFHAWGWRNVSSEKFGIVAIACPRCARMPDSQRGEE